jgi:hypothetical protein
MTFKHRKFVTFLKRTYGFFNSLPGLYYYFTPRISTEDSFIKNTIQSSCIYVKVENEEFLHNTILASLAVVYLKLHDLGLPL